MVSFAVLRQNDKRRVRRRSGAFGYFWRSKSNNTSFNKFMIVLISALFVTPVVSYQFTKTRCILSTNYTDRKKGVSMRKKSIYILIIIVVLSFFPAPAVAGAEETRDVSGLGFDVNISARNAIFINLDSDTVIFEKSADEQVDPASTTKIMTVALAMTLCTDLEATVVTIPVGVWNEFEGMRGLSDAGLLAGEEVTMYDLMHCLMLQSANEAAVAVANYFGRDEFIAKMNEKARELGCVNTHFSNAHGALTDKHYSSARDLATITRWALTVPGFWEISQKSRYQMPATNKKDSVTLVTSNWMQDPGIRYYTPYIKGIKTGTLEAAGRCLVTTAQKDGATYLLVVLGCPMSNSDAVWHDGISSFTDTRLCYDWAFGNLQLENVVDEMSPVAEIKVRYASRRDNLLLYPSGALYGLTRVDMAEEDKSITYEYTELPEAVKAPVKAGDVIGSAQVYYNGKYLGDIDLISREDIELDTFVMIMDTISDILTSVVARIIYIVLLVVILLYLYYVLVLVPNARKRHKKRKRKR